MISRIEFEYEHMIDPGRAPAVSVDSKEEYEQDDEERPSVHLQCWLPVTNVSVGSEERCASTINQPSIFSCKFVTCCLPFVYVKRRFKAIT